MLYKNIQGLNNGFLERKSLQNNVLSSTAKDKSIAHTHDYAHKKPFKDYLQPHKASRALYASSKNSTHRDSGKFVRGIKQQKQSDLEAKAPSPDESLSTSGQKSKYNVETSSGAQEHVKHTAENNTGTHALSTDEEQNVALHFDVPSEINEVVHANVQQLGVQSTSSEDPKAIEQESLVHSYAQTQEVGAVHHDDVNIQYANENEGLRSEETAEHADENAEGVVLLGNAQEEQVEIAFDSDAVNRTHISPRVEHKNSAAVEKHVDEDGTFENVYATVSLRGTQDSAGVHAELSDEDGESHSNNAHTISKTVEQSDVYKNERTASTSARDTNAIEVDSTIEADGIVKHEAESGGGLKVVRHDTTEQFASQKLSQYLKSSGNNELVQQAKLILKQDKSGEVRITLHPKEFGDVKMTFNIDNDKIVGKILVDSQIVKEAVQKNMDNLARQFSHQGFNVGGFFVTVDSNTSEKNNEGWLFARNNENNSMMNSGDVVNEIFTYSYIGTQSDKIDIIA